jgi:hypothetical protein
VKATVQRIKKWLKYFFMFVFFVTAKVFCCPPFV